MLFNCLVTQGRCKARVASTVVEIDELTALLGGWREEPQEVCSVLGIASADTHVPHTDENRRWRSLSFSKDEAKIELSSTMIKINVY